MKIPSLTTMNVSLATEKSNVSETHQIGFIEADIVLRNEYRTFCIMAGLVALFGEM